MTTNTPDVITFFDQDTFTCTHLVIDPDTRRCAIIDPVLDFDPASGRTSSKAVNPLIEAIKERELSVQWILETHVHADHLSAAPCLKSTVGGSTAIGFNVTTIQDTFANLFNVEANFARDGSQFDVLLNDNEAFSVGNIKATALYTPGHTPACMTYLIGDALFVGDTLFMPDYGTARCDFPGGDASILYQSVQHIFAQPDNTRMFICHDYLAEGRTEYAWETTVGEQRRENIHLHQDTKETEFVSMRTARDSTLEMPRLILPAVQINMRAGELPPPEDNGSRYLKLPLNIF